MRSQFLPLDAERMARQPLVPFSNIYKQYARNSRKENICLKLACCRSRYYTDTPESGRLSNLQVYTLVLFYYIV